MAKYSHEFNATFNFTGQDKVDKAEAKARSLQVQMDSLNDTIDRQLNKIAELNEEINHLKYGDGFKEQKAYVQQMETAMSRYVGSFKSWLRTMKLNDLGGTKDAEFEKYIDAIRSGAITVDEAIVKVKTSMRSLIEENYSKSGGVFDSQMVQQFTSTLSTLESTVNGLGLQIKSLVEDGVKVANIANNTSDNRLATILKQIETASAGATGETKNAYASILDLVKAIQGYDNIDVEKIASISRVFGNLASIGEGSFGTKKTDGLINMLNQLRVAAAGGDIALNVSITGLKNLEVDKSALKSLAENLTKLNDVSSKKLKGLNDVKLKNFNNIKVSKSSLSYLSEYLPKIEKVSAAKLKKLETVDLTNFNKVVVNRSSIEAISRLTEALNVLKETQTRVQSSKEGINVGVDAASLSQISSLNAALKEISTINSSITASYKSINKAFSGEGATQKEAEDLNNLRTKYTELQAAIERLKLLKSSATQEDINHIHALQTETQNIITTIQSRITAEKEAAANAVQAAKKEEAAVQKAKKEEEAAALRAAKAEEAAAKQKIADEKAKEAAVKQYYIVLTQIETAIKNYTSAEHSHKNGSKEAYAALISQRDALKQLNGAVSSGTIKTDALKSATSKASETLKSSAATIKANGDATKTWAERIGTLGAKFGTWFSITRVIMYVIRAIRQMISASVELDSAMGQMQIVTKSTESQMNKFADSAANAAKRTGSSITDFVSSATTFARLGYSMDESSQLAEFTAMLQNVGDIDVKDAQDAITSIVKAFDIGTDQIESVMDKLVEVGNNYPVSVSDLAQGMTNASSALAAAGNSFEQSIALLTAANTTINLCRAA